jgi:hypothetical protein
LTKLAFKKSEDGKSVGLTIGMGVTLFGGEGNQSSGAGGGTEFTLWAKHNGKFFAYDKASLGVIKIDCDVSVAKLKGEIEIFNQDATFGNGFRGAVDAQIGGLNAGLKLAVQFGRTLPNKGNFKYWYFDAMVESGVGIPIPGTVAAIYGLGGGAYWNMERSGSEEILAPNAYKPKQGGADAAPTVSGASFEPKKNIAGFNASVLFGLAGTKQAFNGDLKFTMEFNAKTMSVNFIRLDGNAYVMQNPTKPRSPESAMLYCGGFLEVNPENREFFGGLKANLNVLELIKGGGSTAFKFKLPKKDDKGNVVDEQGLKWYIKIGYWTPLYDPFDDPNRLKAKIGFENKVVEFNVIFQTYFMIGNDLPDGLPPLPSYITTMFEQSGMYAPNKKDLPSEVASSQSLAFAWGAGIQLNAGFDFKIVSASLTAEACADVLLANVNATCSGKEIGFAGGWYAKGQAYAYVHGNAELFGLEVAEFAAAAVLQVELPNPTWIRGDVVAYIKILGHKAGDYHGTFEKGKRCEDIETNMDPFANSKLIIGATPINDTKKVNPFTTVMTVNFWYKNNETFEIFNSYKGINESYRFKAKARLLDKDKKEVYIVGAYGDKNYFKTNPFSYLGDNSKYTFEVTAKIEYLFGDNWVIEKEETISTSFTTGEKPSKITNDLILSAYPLPNQRYVMKQGEFGEQMKGWCTMNYDLTYLVGDNEKIIVRLTELGSNKVINIEGAISGFAGATTSIAWTLPSQIANNKFYDVQYFVKNTETKKETILYDGYTFRTSAYNNMKDKMASYKISKVSYVDYAVQVQKNIGGDVALNKSTMYLPVLLMKGGESFEYYDFNVPKTTNQGSELFQNNFLTNKAGSNWLAEQKSRFLNFSNAPELTTNERTYLQSLPSLEKVKRPEGFPFEGETANVFQFNINSDIRAMHWMKNCASYEALLKGNNQLAGNEYLKGYDDPLSSQEIASARNVNNANKGGNGLVNSGTIYSAIIDFSTYVAYHDKARSDAHLLYVAPDNKKWLVFNALDKLNWPKYPSSQSFEMIRVGNDVSHSTPFNWQYKPPMVVNEMFKF